MAFKIFISHVWRAQHEHYWGLIRLLADAKRFAFNDLSVPKFRSFDGGYAAVRDDILSVLRTADVVLAINTPVLTNSQPVQDELREAERLGIPIIAISPPKRHGAMKGSKCGPIQRAYKAHWMTKDIVTAIRDAVKVSARVHQEPDPVQEGFEAVEVAADELRLSAIEIASVLGDDEVLPPSPKAVLSSDFMPLLVRGSARTQST